MLTNRNTSICGVVGFLLLFFTCLLFVNVLNADEREQLIKHADEILKTNPLKGGEKNKAEMQLNRAISLVEKGRLDEAIEQFLKVIEKNPNYGPAYSNLGAAYYQKGQLEKAIETFQKAIELNPNDKAAHSNLGKAYTDAGKYDEAIAEHKKVIGIAPNDAEAPPIITEQQGAVPQEASSEILAESTKLFVLNVSGPTLIPSNQNITDNGLLIVSLPRKTYKSIHIAPGSHEFRFKGFPKGPRVARLYAKKGSTYYLVVGYSPERSWAFPFGGDPMTIKLVTEDEAHMLMKDMRPE